MKSLILFRKVCNMVYCCGLDIPQWKTREKIKQLCEAGNNNKKQVGDYWFMGKRQIERVPKEH